MPKAPFYGRVQALTKIYMSGSLLCVPPMLLSCLISRSGVEKHNSMLGSWVPQANLRCPASFVQESYQLKKHTGHHTVASAYDHPLWSCNTLKGTCHFHYVPLTGCFSTYYCKDVKKTVNQWRVRGGSGGS